MEPPLLSRLTHPRVVAWISNFAEAKRDTAGLLIDALALVSGADLRRSLGDLIAGLLPTLPGPVAAFPARETQSGEAAHGEGREGTYALLEPGLPGSEAVVGNILKAVLRRPTTGDQLLEELDLATLRDAKVRTILLVDDFSGSGKRLIDYHKALLRHKTLRSWSSFHWIEFHVVAYAATNRAARLLRRRFGEDHVHLVRACPTFAGAGWTNEQLAEVEDLCIARAGRQNKRRALGFRDSRALIAFEHTAPNNLPYILWKVGEQWQSLFEGKGVPTDLLRLYTIRPGPPQEPVAGSAGAKRLGKVVDLLGRRVRQAGEIAEIADLSFEEVARLLALVKQLGLADAGLRLTDLGRVELNRWRAAHAIRELPNRSGPYYPRQLRAER